MSADAGERAQFVAEIEDLIDQACDECIGEAGYEDALVGNRISQDVVQDVLKRLGSLGKPYKFIVNSVLQQSLGAGLHNASVSLWDNDTDFMCVRKWDKNPNMTIIVNVYVIAL